MQNKKNVLITGAAGFIGFHLAKSLKKRGDNVTALDNFNDYYDPKLKKDRADILKKEGIEIHSGDICDVPFLRKIVEAKSITHIAHLAAQAGVRYSITHPEVYLKANIEGFINILEICRLHTKIKLIYASSSSVYGLNTKVPFSEEDRTDSQASFYGTTKKSNELMAQTYHHLFGIPVTGLRFFTVYGPWGRPDMAYFSFTKNILLGNPIEIFNNGLMQRDFTYIDDIIQGILSAIDLGAPCEVFNLGNQKPVKLLTLVELIEKQLGKTAKKVFKPMQQGDVVSTYANITHSHEKLGFMPQISIEEGIKNFVSWYKDYFKA